jgi:hypothetical protein
VVEFQKVVTEFLKDLDALHWSALLKESTENIHVMLAFFVKWGVTGVFKLDPRRFGNTVHEWLNDKVLSKILLPVQDERWDMHLVKTINDRPLRCDDTTESLAHHVRLVFWVSLRSLHYGWIFEGLIHRENEILWPWANGATMHGIHRLQRSLVSWQV